MRLRAIKPWAVIAAILLLTLVVTFFWAEGLPVTAGARRDRCANFLSSLGQALRAYQIDHGDFPGPGAANLAVLSHSRFGHSSYFDFGRNMNAQGMVVDEWGRPIIYRSNAPDPRIGTMSHRSRAKS